jgi:hypothetical protein
VAFVGSGLFLRPLATHAANKAESEAAEDDETYNNEANDDEGALEH